MINNINIRIGKKLKELRVSRGFSQSYVGDKIGKTFQQIQKYEAGTTKVSAERLLWFSKFYKVSIASMYEEYEDFIDDKEILKGISMLRSAKKENLKRLVNILKAASDE